MANVFTDDNFQKEVLDSEKLVVVDFWAPWCGPCRIQGPIVEDVAEVYGDEVSIGKLNVDDNPQTASQYGIMSIPTIKFFKNGDVVDEVIGLQTKESLQEKVDNLK